MKYYQSECGDYEVSVKPDLEFKVTSLKGFMRTDTVFKLSPEDAFSLVIETVSAVADSPKEKE